MQSVVYNASSSNSSNSNDNGANRNHSNSSPTDDESKGQEQGSEVDHVASAGFKRLNAEELSVELESIISCVSAALDATYELTEMVQCISTKFIEREFSIHHT